MWTEERVKRISDGVRSAPSQKLYCSIDDSTQAQGSAVWRACGRKRDYAPSMIHIHTGDR